MKLIPLISWIYFAVALLTIAYEIKNRKAKLAAGKATVLELNISLLAWTLAAVAVLFIFVL